MLFDFSTVGVADLGIVFVTHGRRGECGGVCLGGFLALAVLIRQVVAMSPDQQRYRFPDDRPADAAGISERNNRRAHTAAINSTNANVPNAGPKP